MLGIAVNGQLLAAVRVAVPGKFQGVIPLGQAGDGEVQVPRPPSAAQLSAVLVPQGHNGGIAAQVRPAVFCQSQGSQGTAFLVKLRPDPPVPKGLQGLRPVHPDRGGDGAAVRAASGGGGCRKTGDQQRPGQQQG